MKDAELNGHPGVSVWSGDGIPGCSFPNTKPRGWCETRGFTVFAILTVHSAHAKDPELAAGTMGCEYGV